MAKPDRRPRAPPDAHLRPPIPRRPGSPPLRGRLALERLAVRTVLSLPSAALRLLAGGGAVYRGGRTLDPRFQLLAAFARRQPAVAERTPEEVRRANAQALAVVSGAPAQGVSREPLEVPGAAGPLRARLYRPAGQDPAAPVMVYAHFGGGVIGDLEAAEAFCSLLAAQVRCPVVSVEYRLAPEHRFPAGLEDMLAAYRWCREQAARFGAPPGEAMIGGDSMGGNFAAVIPQLLKAAGEPQPRLQLLIYPAVDMSSETPSMATYGEAFPLTRSYIDWFLAHYLGPDADPADPRASPLRAASLEGLAPAVMASAGFDPLLDQGEAYAKALKAAGVPTAYRCYDSLAHGFTAFTGAVPAAEAACREIAALVRASVEGRARP
jgi:acetyl esterase